MKRSVYDKVIKTIESEEWDFVDDHFPHFQLKLQLYRIERKLFQTATLADF